MQDVVEGCHDRWFLRRAAISGRLRREGQSKRNPQAAQFRSIEVELPAIELDKLTGDRQPESEAGRTFVDSLARPQNQWNLIRPQARPVVLDHDRNRSSFITMRVNLDLFACRSERVVEQIAGHLVEILLLACNREIARHALRKDNSLVRINFSERIGDVVNARRNRRLRARWPTQGRGAGAPEMMTDAPFHQYDQRMKLARRIAAAFRQGARDWRRSARATR